MLSVRFHTRGNPSGDEQLALATVYFCVHDFAGVHWGIDRLPNWQLPVVVANHNHDLAIGDSGVDCSGGSLLPGAACLACLHGEQPGVRWRLWVCGIASRYVAKSYNAGGHWAK